MLLLTIVCECPFGLHDKVVETCQRISLNPPLQQLTYELFHPRSFASAWKAVIRLCAESVRDRFTADLGRAAAATQSGLRDETWMAHSFHSLNHPIAAMRSVKPDIRGERKGWYAPAQETQIARE